MLLLVFVSLALVYVSYMFYFRPQIAKLAALRRELQETKTVYQAALDNGWSDIPKIQRRIARAEDKLKALDDQMPPYKNTPAVLVDLYQLAVKYDLTRVDDDNGKVVVGNLENHDYYSSYDINMSITGTSAGVYGFLYEVPRLGRTIV
ncbi:MAG: type 4a pilus biogenesis protein PilO, partial [Bacillota bacterium]